MTRESDAKQSQPLVSVLVACYNQARYVEECLESVRAQTYGNLELIIIDDHSLDDSAYVIRRWLETNKTTATFVVHEENLGVCKTFNDALHRCNGKYISLLAADDVYLPDKIESQVAILENSPTNVGVVYSDAWRIDADGRLLDEKFIKNHCHFEVIPQGQIFSALLGGNFIPAPAALIRRDCFEKLGFFDEALFYEDFDMWLRIARQYQFVFSPNILVKYRVIPGSMTRAALRQGEAGLESDFRIYEKWIRSDGLSSNERQVIKSRLASIAFHMYAIKSVARNRCLRRVLRYNPCTYTLAMWLCGTSGVPFKYFERVLLKRSAINGQRAPNWSSSVALR